MINTAKLFYHKFLRLKKSNIFKKQMKNLVEDAGIPPLTREEETKLKDYWKKYGYQPDLNAYRYLYAISGIRDCRFITSDFYDCYLIPKLYNVQNAAIMDDKNMYDMYFADVKKPETLVRNMNGVFMDKSYHKISKLEAIDLVRNVEGQVVIKPSVDSCCGKNVNLFDAKDVESQIALYDKNYIIQKRVIQHPIFAKFNESSSNVVRITSVFMNDNVYLCSPTIRIGDSGRFTDQGGVREFCVGINEEGKFKTSGLSTKDKVSRDTTMPNGFVFGGVNCPGWDEMQSIAKNCHPRLNKFPIIGWDFITDEDGNANLIECNLHWSGIFKYQQCNGPIFGEFTDEILNAVFR